jgi:hypothetical protein
MAYVTSTVSTTATYMAKYVAGGSGDNIVPDGYIKSVEKVWIDSYTIAFTNTLTAIAIAELPPNKKVVSIQIEVYSSVSQTSATISVGYLYDAANVLATGGCSDFLPASTITHNLTRTSIALPTGIFSGNMLAGSAGVINYGTLAGFQAVTGGTATTIAIKLNNWTMTTGTIKSIVRYT